MVHDERQLDLGLFRFIETYNWIQQGRYTTAWCTMIPKTQFKRAVIRFEKATRRLKCHRKCVSAAGRRETASILFEFREAKRELLQLGNLLITGEIPDKAFDPANTKPSEYLLVSSQDQTIRNGMGRFAKVSPAHGMPYGEPKTSGGVGRK